MIRRSIEPLPLFKDPAWKLNPLARADAHQTPPTHFRFNDLRNINVRRCVPVNEGVAPGASASCRNTLRRPLTGSCFIFRTSSTLAGGVAVWAAAVEAASNASNAPAMFRRDPGAGSLYWLGLRDKDGAYLDGANPYKLTVPLPVPNKLFWSVTVYDAETRSQIQTDQGKAALRSLFELKDVSGSAVDLYFGPSVPSGQEGRWIKTLPGKGWFVYFRIYGPDTPAFNGQWKPGDFERTK